MAKKVKEVETTNKEVVKAEKVKEYLVTAPVKDFNGKVAGVHFAYGQAKVRPGWILDWFIEKGYTVEEVK